MKRTVFRTLLILSVLLAALLCHAALAEDATHIVILGTSDMHGNVWGWTYEDGTETTNNGMARLYTYIQQVREENPLTFLVDGGDEKKLENGKRVEKRGAGTVKVVNRGDAPAYLAVETRRLPDPAKAAAVSNGMTIETEICRATGEREKVDPSTLRRGDNAMLVVKLSLKNACKTTDFVVDIPLPACFEPGSSAYVWLLSEQYELRREARDDRVVIFTRPYDAKAGETLEFLVPVSVVTAGDFAFPGASAEAMYIPELNARAASSRIAIAK